MNSKIIAIDSGGHRERVLAKRKESQHTNCCCARNALVTEHLDMVPAIARRIARRLPPSFDLDDLIAVGNLALLRAAAKYQPADHDNTPFQFYARHVVRGAMLDSVKRGNWALGTHLSLEELPEPVVPNVIDIEIDAERLSRRLFAVIATLPERERAVLGAYYGPEEPSFEVVGDALDICRQQASKIRDSALDNLRDALKAA